jgi:pilin isopeptide linkage protein
MVTALFAGVPARAFAAEGDETAASHATKTLTPNNDGTYNLSINVKGSSTSSSSQEVTPVDIVLVLDVSGSMDESMTGTTKMNALKSAVNSFLDSTAAQNEKISDDNSKIHVSLVKFAGTQTNAVGDNMYREGGYWYNYSQIVSDFTKDMSGLKTSVSNLRAAGATSADYGMSLAQSQLNKARSGAQKYVIFFTDGEPNHSSGFDQSVANSAIGAARDLKSNGTTIYSIGVLDGANPSADPTSRRTSRVNKYMQAVSSNYPNAESYTSLGDGNYRKGYYKSATSSSELSAIFADIFNDISQKQTVTNVSITDHLTGMTVTALVDGKADNFTYTKTDADNNTTALEGFPPASFRDGTITWNLGDTVLDPDYTYTVTAKVWPSQDALDLVADLNNGTKQYSDLTADQQAQLKLVDSVYTLYTNPATGNTISYKTVTTKTSSKAPSGTTNDDGTITGDDGFTYTKNADGTWTGTKTSADSTTDNITNPTNGMPVSNQQISFKKIWEGGSTAQESLTAELQKDGAKYVPVTVTSKNSWTTTTNVAMGIIDGSGNVLENGHDYTVVEPSGTDYHFEYSGETYRPMLINNVPTVLVKIDGQEEGAYQIADSWYKAAADTGTFTATNVRKSSVNLSKTVVDNSASSDAPSDALFTFTAKVTDSKASDGNVWFSIQDASGNTVKDADRVSGATAETGDTGDTGYYYAASGSEITLKLKAGDNVRFINVSTGATYSFSETAMDKGFSFTSATADEATISGQTASGTVAQANKDYKVAFTDTYDATAPTEFKATKTVSGYDWNKSADIQISATGDNADCVKIPNGTQRVSNIKNGESRTVTFSGIEFLAKGTYELSVKETTTSDAKGWKYDNSDHIITVKVAKGDDGKLAVTDVQGDNPTITNTYKADSVMVNTVDARFFNKNVGTGNNNGSYTFSFSVAPQYGAPAPTRTSSSVTYDANETGTKAVDFGSITFDAAGTYTYKVTETTPSDGWKTPNAEATVTVTVTDDGSGQLAAEVTGSSITNNYGTDNVTVDTKAEGAAFLTKSFEVPGGLTPSDKTFDFTLTACDEQGNIADGATPLSGSVTYDKEQPATSAAIDFGTLTFTEEGTYYYKAQETTADGDGWTKSGDEPIIKVVVSNDGRGKLVATVSGTGTITNAYKTNGTEVDTDDATTGVFLTKAYSVADGLTPSDKKFEFSIAEVDADGSAIEGGYTNTGSANYVKGQAETSTAVDLGKITYTEPGTHYYKVTETSENMGGWAKAENSDFIVQVDVTDNGKGQLVAAVTGTGSIANGYSVAPAASDPPVYKTVTGNPSKDATFSFTLTPENAAYPMPEGSENGVKTTSITGSGSSEFGSITFAAPGTYTYTVAEVKGDAGGYEYATNVHTLTYTVTDNGDGTLAVSRTIDGEENAADNAVSFTNKYSASGTVDTDAEGSAFLTKAYSVTDGLTPSDKTFEFSIAEVDADGSAVEGGYTNTGSAHYAAGDASEAVDLGTITYTEPGTHYYKVTETTDDGGGWTKSGDGYTVTVTVTDQGDGTLRAAVSGTGTITNTLVPAKLDEETNTAVKVTKTLYGRDSKPGETFTFTMSPAGSVTTSAVETGAIKLENDTATVSTAKDGQPSDAAFGPMTFAQAGTYTFNVSENKGTEAGMSYDASVKTLTVKVADLGGKLVADAEGDLSFTNTYTATGSYTPEGTKQLLGNPTETAADEDEATHEESTTDTEQTQNETADAPDAEKSADSSSVSEAVSSGTDATEPAEVAEAAEDAATEDETASSDVAVAESTDSTTDAEADAQPIAGIDAALAFLAPTQANADEPDVATTTGSFAFFVTYANGNAGSGLAGSEVSRGTATVEYGKTEDIAFNTISYKTGSADDAGTLEYLVANGAATKNADGSYDITYLVKENKTSDPFQLNTQTFTFTVHVVDNGNGTLAASLAEGSSAIAFVNHYITADVTVSMSGLKVMNGTRSIEAGDYSFTIKGSDGAPMPAEATVKNAAGGSVDFGTITFTKDDLGSATEKTFTYTITEDEGDKPGVSYSDEAQTVTVTVKDNGNGTLSATTNPATTPLFTITNTYTPTPNQSSVTDQIKITKELTGRDLTAGEFTFQLKDASGNVVSEATNAADGTITFAPVSFTAAGDYTYQISELDNGVAGVTYDAISSYSVTAHVVDHFDGKPLEVTWTYGGGSQITFKNSYSSDPGTSSVTDFVKITKELTGRDLTAGEFTFQLKDADGNVVSTATNAADGTIIFNPITFTEVGTYTYTVSEVNSGADNITYDDSVYTVTATVTDNGDGTKSVVWSYEGGSIVFKNTYTAPAAPEPAKPAEAKPVKTPDTSDTNAGSMAFGAITVAGIVALGVGIALKRREH